MRIADRYEPAKDLGPRYWAGGRQEPGVILDAFCLATGYGRKHAITMLRGRRRTAKPGQPRPRQRLYSLAFRQAVRVLWDASGYICSERLQPFLPELAGLLEQHGQLTLDDDPRELLAIVSISTVERTVASLRRGLVRTASMITLSSGVA